jgi:HSP20 family protein
MSTMLPERWKESLEQIGGKLGHFLELLKPHKGPDHNGPEHVTAELLPAFMQSGGPRLDMYESEAELVVTIEVPGLDKNEISLELAGKRLIVRGEKHITRERKAAGSGLYSEKRYGGFIRSLQLPCDVDHRSITADLKRGVLTVRLPKPESERNRRHRVPVA